MTLPDSIQIFPGHDYGGQLQSTIGQERRGNKRLTMGREAFLETMRSPRPSRPALLEKALAYNSTP